MGSLIVGGMAAGVASCAMAQVTTEAPTVEVVGLRAALEKSLDLKANSAANVEVISAEDVGRMPDKNIADSLQRVSGVAVRINYDEAEKFALRGTNPNMSLLLFNGHSISGGDWYLSDQISGNRSASLNLLPSSVIDVATVYKTSMANIPDGGLAGTVNITTRKPLEQRKSFGALAEIGAVYADLPARSAPQAMLSVNWKNETNTFGTIATLFAEKRYLRRDSQSRFAYATNNGWDVINTSVMKGVTDESLVGSGLRAADLNGVRIPGSMTTELAEGVRDRRGGLVAVQVRPFKELDVSANFFDSSMGATNYGRAMYGGIISMLRGCNTALTGACPATPSSNPADYASIRNPVVVDTVSGYGFPMRVLSSAEISYQDGVHRYVGATEGYYRAGAAASSQFADLEANFAPDPDLKFRALFSTTRGVGLTERDQGYGGTRYGNGIAYRINGLDRGADFRYIDAGAYAPVRDSSGAGFVIDQRGGAVRYRTVDREQSIALDLEAQQGTGPFESFALGLRFTDHRRDMRRAITAYRSAIAASLPASGFTTFPADFGSGFDAQFDNGGFFVRPADLRAWIDSQTKSTTPAWERSMGSEIELQELNSALYAQQNFEAEAWSGNVGLRLVRTDQRPRITVPVPLGKCKKIEPGKSMIACTAYPEAVVTAGNGAAYYDNTPFNPNTIVYFKEDVSRVFDDVLPSANLRWTPAPGLIARGALNRTIGRQSYNVIGAGFFGQSCTADACTITGPNPDLRPMYADNLDLSLAWHFAPRSLAQVNVFGSRISGYPKTGTYRQGKFVELPDIVDETTTRRYEVISATQQNARIQGVEVAFERPLAYGFGVVANATRVRTRTDDGRPMIGAAETAANLVAYYENEFVGVRVAYNYQGKYEASNPAPSPIANSQSTTVIQGTVMPTAPVIAAPTANLALSLTYKPRKDIELSFSGLNLTNPVRSQYRYSEAEVHRQDLSGRQYYLTARMRFD